MTDMNDATLTDTIKAQHLGSGDLGKRALVRSERGDSTLIGVLRAIDFSEARHNVKNGLMFSLRLRVGDFDVFVKPDSDVVIAKQPEFDLL